MAKLLHCGNQMNFKNIFKNIVGMTTENTEKEQEFDDSVLEQNANGEQILNEEVEEISIEEQLTQDLAKEKDKFLLTSVF